MIHADLIRGKIDALIMRRIADGEAYGSEIQRFIEETSGGTYGLKKPTLYSALRRLEDKKFIAGRDKHVDGIRRRYFLLTEKGEEYFKTRKDDWRSSNVVIGNLLGEHDVEAAIVIKKFFTEKSEESEARIVPITNSQGVVFDLPLGQNIMEPLPSPTPITLPPTTQAPLKTYVLAEQQPEQFKKYLGPEERPSWERVQKEKDNTALERLDAITGSKPLPLSQENSGIFILPFGNSWRIYSNKKFILMNRLRMVVSFCAALLVAFSLAATGALVTDQVGGDTVFVLGFIALAIYLGINVAIFAVYPFLKKRSVSYRSEFLIRFAISASLVITILGANLVAGLRDNNLEQYFAFFLVPALLSIIIFLEGVGIYLLKRISFFQV
ncbi:MAG: PadR family transcriptional regulator [Firmicutes bacterium]|nr:PadR family transcriptional regulator [Bacillota bacterium]